MIDAYNRVLVIVLKLVLLAAAVLALIVLLGVEPTFMPAGWLRDSFTRLYDLSGGRQGIAIAASIGAILVALFGLLLEIPRGRRKRPLLIESGDRGSVIVEPRSIRMLVDNISREVEGVRDVRSDIREYAGGVSITVWPTVEFGARVPVVAREIQSRAKEAVERLAGLPVSDVTVMTEYKPARERRNGAALIE